MSGVSIRRPGSLWREAKDEADNSEMHARK